MLHVLAGVFGAGLIALMLVEFFLTYLLPRRVKRDPRVARQLYRLGCIGSRRIQKDGGPPELGW